MDSLRIFGNFKASFGIIWELGDFWDSLRIFLEIFKDSLGFLSYFEGF